MNIPHHYHPKYTSHDPIYIVGDDAFTESNGVVSGSGTKDDPYIINGWEICASSHKDGIFIANTTAYVVIEYCHIYSKEMSYVNGIKIENASNIKIINVIIEGCEYGIFLYKTYACIIDGCTIKNCSENGILVYMYNNVTAISLTEVYNTGSDAIYITKSNGTTIYQCDIHNASECGIYVSQSNYTYISNNKIYFNGDDGLCMDDCGGCVITGNLFYKNGHFGVCVYAIANLTKNTFYGNDFIDNMNSPQALDEIVDNWNISTGGNYWSDYTGTDSNSDGIGDTPYVLETGIGGYQNKDYMPRMERVTTFPLPQACTTTPTTTTTQTTGQETEETEKTEGGVPTYVYGVAAIAVIAGVVVVLSKLRKFSISRLASKFVQ